MLAVVKTTRIALLVTTNDRRKTPVKFCVKITQKRASSRPNWLPDKKNSAKCIWCITYTSTEESSGKLTGMNKTGFSFDPVCQTRPAPDRFRHDAPIGKLMPERK